MVQNEKEDCNRIEVQKWLDEQLDLRSGNWTVSEVPVLPGGVLLEDKEGKTLYVWYDIMKQRVVWR